MAKVRVSYDEQNNMIIEGEASDVADFLLRINRPVEYDIHPDFAQLDFSRLGIPNMPVADIAAHNARITCPAPGCGHPLDKHAAPSDPENKSQWKGCTVPACKCLLEPSEVAKMPRLRLGPKRASRTKRQRS